MQKNVENEELHLMKSLIGNEQINNLCKDCFDRKRK